MASAKTTASGGQWSTTGAALSKELPVRETHVHGDRDREERASATRKGKAGPVAFEVDTEPPTRDDRRRRRRRSNDTTPVVLGRPASEDTEVVVHVMEGATEVASAKTTASGGQWSTTGALSKALPSGKHSFTAIATEKSGIGNAEGTSGTVGVRSRHAAAHRDDRGAAVSVGRPTPSFSGEASENTEVVVHVIEGATEVASGENDGVGREMVDDRRALSKELPSGKHSFTATATEKSALAGNAGRQKRARSPSKSTPNRRP